MKQEIINRIVKNMKLNSNVEQDEHFVLQDIKTTEEKLGRELTGYAVIDKSYNIHYTEEQLNKNFPKGIPAKFIIEKAREQSDKIAFRCERNFTYGDLADGIIKFAYVLKNKYGLKPGDNICMDILSSPDAICEFMGANLIGVRIRPVDPVSSPEQVKSIIKEYDAKLLLTNDLFYKDLKNVIDECNIPVSYTSLKDNLPLVKQPKKSVVLGLSKLSQLFMKKNNDTKWSFYNDLISDINVEKINIEELACNYSEDMIAMFIPTSGTTGEAKGVEITNESLMSNAIKELVSDFDVDSNDSLFNPMPTSSSFFWYVVVLTTYWGVATDLSPMFDAEHSPDQILNVDSSWVLLGPIIINQICQLIDKSNKVDSEKNILKRAINKVLYKSLKTDSEVLKNKKHYISGGDMLLPSLYERATSLGLEINDNLGTSENGGPSLNPNGARKDKAGFAPGSVGVILPGNNMGIFPYDHENNKPDFDAENYNLGCEYYEVGEICFDASNPNVFKGYYKNPKATSEAIITHSDGKTWYHSGDLGYMDVEGHVYCKGRKSGLIVRDGHKIWLGKIENIVKTIDGIKDCAVVGTDDPIDKEVPVCFVSYDDSLQEFEKEKVKNLIYLTIERELDKKHLPAYYKELESIPKNIMGKTSIKDLKPVVEELKINQNSSKKRMLSFLKKVNAR